LNYAKSNTQLKQHDKYVHKNGLMSTAEIFSDVNKATSHKANAKHFQASAQPNAKAKADIS